MRFDMADYLINEMLRNGASECEVAIGEQDAMSIGSRLGKFEKFNKASHCCISVRAFYGEQVAVAKSEDVSLNGLKSLAEKVVSMAKNAPKNPFARLPFDDEVYVEEDYANHKYGEVDSAKLFQLAVESEEIALSMPKIFTSEGAEVSCVIASTYMKNSNGAHGYETQIQYSSSLAVVAKSDNGDMEYDYDFSIGSSLDRLKSSSDLGKNAAQRAIAKLGSKKIKSQSCDILFDKRVSNQLLQYFISAINGNSIYKKSSFLYDKLNKEVFSSNVNIVSDPFIKNGVRSSKFDADLVKCRKLNLIKNGILQYYMLGIEAANKLNMKTNGFSAGNGGITSYNTYVENGGASPDDMIKSIKSGVLITSLMGMGIDEASGNYSQGISGFKIENGEIVYPVKEITLAGNMLDIFARVEFANDLEYLTGCDAPSAFVSDMAIAGE